MPREIVTETSRGKSSGRAKKLSGQAGFQNETCPAPECNLSTKDVKQFVNESKRYMKLLITLQNDQKATAPQMRHNLVA